jgi:ribosomal protein S18 acetylase RimI-like enzyme
MLDKMYSSLSLLQQMHDGHLFTIAYDDLKPIGYISISSQNNSDYFLHKFYIDTQIQNKGVGAMLFDYVLDSIPNARTIELTVNRNNFKAINFYFKQGFKIKKVADFDIGNGYFMNDFVMIKTMEEK